MIASNPEATPQASAPRGDAKARILVLESDRGVRDDLLQRLRERWEATAAGDCRDALDVMNRQRLDLVLVDEATSELAGPGSLRELRAEAAKRSIGVLAICDDPGEGSPCEELEAGVDDCLVKPFSERELMARVATTLRLRALQTSVERGRAAFAEIFQGLQIPVAIVRGPELVFELANPAFLRAMGWRDVLGRPLSQATPELVRRGCDAQLRAVMQTGVTYVGREEPLRLERNGSLEDTYWTFIYVALRGDSPGNDRVVAVYEDVTEAVRSRKVLEHAREEERELRGAVELERAKLERFLMDAPVAMAIFEGPDHHCTFLSRVAREYVPASLLGQAAFDALPEAVEQGYKDLLDCVYTSGQIIARRELFARSDIPVSQKLAQGIFMDVVVAPTRNQRGEVTGICFVAADVSERVRDRRVLERALAENEQQREALRDARLEAEAASRAKDEFLAMLGHELRNPLSPILTALQLMRLRGTQSREQDIIERQIGHLVRLVDDLMDVSRIARGKLELRKRRCELAKIVIQAVELASPLLEQRRQPLDVHVPRVGLCVDADLDRMAQVVSNLLANASKYSDPGSRIVVKGTREGPWVRVSVKDEGIGIAPDMLGKVFDRFVQQPQALDRAKGGIGLGLTIVKSLVELHGGTAAVHSEGPGRGSEFVIELPASELSCADQESELELANAKDAAQARERERGRILVVDDNDDAADTLAVALEQLGYVVEIAYDGPSALAKAQAFRPDVALLDIGLPVMDGYELASKLRELGGAPQRPRLVAITGYGQEADRRRSAAAGFEKHLVKPVDLTQLESILRSTRS
jgi:signal transduction histidine kinase/DNA-binding response OmpR family regulator